jgi:hypothetical protein
MTGTATARRFRLMVSRHACKRQCHEECRRVVRFCSTCRVQKLSVANNTASTKPFAQGPCFRDEPTALLVGETRAPGADLFPQYTALFLKIVDGFARLLADQAGERDQDELQRMRQRRHGGHAYQKTVGSPDAPAAKPTSAPHGKTPRLPRRSGSWTAGVHASPLPQVNETAQVHCLGHCRTRRNPHEPCCSSPSQPCAAM